MSDVFVSYSSADRPRVKPLVEALEQKGWSVWWDRTMLAGSAFDRVIEAALRDSRCAIVLWSKASIESDWVWTEADEGRRRGILVPALLDDVGIPFAFRRIQTATLVGWSGALPSGQFDELARAVTAVLARTTPSGGQPGAREQTPEEPIPEIPKPLVYILRPSNPQGKWTRPHIYCDGVDLGKVRDGRYMNFRTSPGSHVISTKDSQIELACVNGEIYYLSVAWIAGNWTSTAELTSVSDEDANDIIEALRPNDE